MKQFLRDRETDCRPGGKSALAAFFISVAVILGTASTVRAQIVDPQTTQPNILIILTDDMGIGDCSCYGGTPKIQTPHIDKIASQGTRFMQYYSVAPICSASRSGIITGRFSAEVRINSYLQTKAGNRVCEQDDFLDTAFPMFPRYLKKAGYATALIGKWHMGGGRDVDNAPYIQNYGYDFAASTWESPNPWPPLGVKYAPWDRRVEPGQVVRDRRTEYMVNKTLEFFKENKGRPTFVFLCPDDMHTPYRPGKKMQEKYGGSNDERKTPLKNYEGVLDEYDRQIGRLMTGMDDLGITSNTLVIFTSDNGPAPTFNHVRTRGFRGMKMSLYEGGTRMPLLVRWPGHTPVGKVDETSVLSGADWFLTLCDAADAHVPDEVAATIEGEDSLAALEGKPFKRTKRLLWEYGRHPRGQGYAYPGHKYDVSPNVGIREEDWKLLVNADGTGVELYNVVKDPLEKNNVAADHKDLAARLSAEAVKWRKSVPPAQYHKGLPHY